MQDLQKTKDDIKELFESQRLGVLATRNKEQPYTSLVAFVADEHLKYLLFATTRTTRKYANISGDTRVAFLVDNRSNAVADFSKATAVTVTGKVRELKDEDRDQALSLYLAKHPHLESFATSPNCALLRIEVERLIVVTRFQNVIELHVK